MRRPFTVVKSRRILSRMHSKEAQNFFSEVIRALGINFPGESDLAKGAKLKKLVRIIKDSPQHFVFGFRALRRTVLRTVSEFHVET